MKISSAQYGEGKSCSMFISTREVGTNLLCDLYVSKTEMQRTRKDLIFLNNS